MPFTDEDRDLLELCIQAQAAQIAFSCKMAGADSALMVDTVQKLERIAEKLRAADVRENVHSHWEKPTQVGNYTLKNIPHCSACGYIPCDEGKRFCANCGAIMDGGDEE